MNGMAKSHTVDKYLPVYMVIFSKPISNIFKKKPTFLYNLCVVLPVSQTETEKESNVNAVKSMPVKPVWCIHWGTMFHWNEPYI